MASLVAAVLTSLGLLCLSSVEAITTDNTTMWTDGTHQFFYTNNTLAWLTGGGNPGVFPVAFQDQRTHLESIDFHYAWRQLVFSETGTKTMFVWRPTGGSASFAHVGTSPLVGHVTVDWLSNNLYWADAGFGWIGLQSLKEDMGTMATNDRLKVVVSASLDSPYGVAVLPHMRRIFWTDFGQPPKLESAGLLGDNRRVLVWQGLSKPTVIAADVHSSRIYWIDEAKATIESCSVSGTDRKLLIYSKGTILGGLHVFENYILFTNRDSGTIHASHKDTGATAAASFNGGSHPEAITVFSSVSQPRDDVRCNSTSCDHICIHDAPASCVCASGYTLLPNGTCQESVTSLWKSFLLSNTTRICAVPVTLLYSHKYLPPINIRRSIQCFVSGTGIRHLAVDSHNASVYYVSGTSVHVHNIHTGQQSVVYSRGDEISGLAYDWVSVVVVWSERGSSNKILRLARGTTQPQTPQSSYTGLSNPQHLAVDPRRGDLFWFESVGGSYQLYRGKVAGGQNKAAIFSSDLTLPHSLVYNHRTDRLYWLDTDYVGSVTRNGTAKNQVALSSVTQPKGLTVFRDNLIWTAGTTSTNVTFKDVDLTQGDDPVTFTLPDPMDVTGLVFYDANENTDDACELNNGGCSQLCMSEGDGYECHCNFGYELAADERSCVTEYTDNNFFIVTDKLSSELYQIGRSGKSVWARVTQEGAQPQEVAYNRVTREIIWFDVEARVIKVSALDGSTTRVLRAVQGSRASDTHSVTSLCVDTSSNNLYYAESRDNGSEGWIRVTSISTKVTRTLATVSQLRFLAISPQTGKLVYGTVSGGIRLAHMTLENDKILRSGVTGLSGLTFANNGATVVWSDSEADEIVELNTHDGSHTTRLEKSGNRPRSVVASGSDLYFFTNSGRSIKRLSEAGKEDVIAEYAEFGELTSLYFQGTDTTQEVTACSEKNGRCSTLCIPTPSGRQCQCADSVDLEEDKRTCRNVEKCPDVIQHGQLSTSCDRYPAESCDFTCTEGYKKNPALPSTITCGSSGQWDAPLDTLCLITCPRVLTNGQVSAACGMTAGAECSIECDSDYEVPSGASGKIVCGEDGQWLHQPGQVCRLVSDGLPVYAIAIIAVAAALVVILVIGCFLYRRMKKYGGRDSARTGFDNFPVVFVTDSNQVNGAAKQIDNDDDNASAEYSELEPVADEVRYQSFSRISPRPGRQRLASQRPPVGGFDNTNTSWGLDGKGLKPWDAATRGLHDDDDDDHGNDPLPQSYYLTPVGVGGGASAIQDPDYIRLRTPQRANSYGSYITPPSLAPPPPHGATIGGYVHMTTPRGQQRAANEDYDEPVPPRNVAPDNVIPDPDYLQVV